MCNTGFPSYISNVILNFIQKSHPETNEHFGFLCFHHLKTVRFLRYIWSRRQDNGSSHLVSQKGFVTGCMLSLFPLDPFSHQNYWPHTLHISSCLRMAGKGRSKRISRPVNSLLQVCERKEEELLRGEQDARQCTRLIV